MPDDKLSMEELLTQAAGGEPTPEPAPEATPEPTPEEGTDPKPEEGTDPTPEEGTDPKPEEGTDPKPEPKKPNPMKEVRDRLNAEKAEKDKISKAITQFTQGDYEFTLKDHLGEDGTLDYDSLTAAMEAADVAKRAGDKGLSPEIQAELERIEKEKAEIQKERLRLSMDKALTNLQMDLKITGADVNNFFKDSMDQKRNPYQWLAQGGSLKDLYNIVYADKLKQSEIDSAVAAARATWEAERGSGRPPASNPAGATKGQQGAGKTGLSMEDLLERAAQKKR